MLQKNVLIEKAEFSLRTTLQFLCFDCISVEIGSCETPSKQKKYSEKHSFICGGEHTQDRRERPWDTRTIF